MFYECKICGKEFATKEEALEHSFFKRTGWLKEKLKKEVGI